MTIHSSNPRSEEEREREKLFLNNYSHIILYHPCYTFVEMCFWDGHASVHVCVYMCLCMAGYGCSLASWPRPNPSCQLFDGFWLVLVSDQQEWGGV